MRRKMILVSVLVLLMLFAVAPLMSLSVKAEESAGKSKVETTDVQPAATIFTEGFEGAFPGAAWVVGDWNPTSGLDYWDDVSYRAHSGSWSGWCAGYGAHPLYKYDLDMEAYMYRTVALSGYSSVTLSYWYWLDSESGYDYLKVMYRVGATWYYIDPHSGSSGGFWVYRSVSIPNTANAVGFYFLSDYIITYEGAYVDDVTLSGIPTLYGNYHFVISPFVDVMHINAGGGVINGIDVAPSYQAQVLGSYSGNNFYMAIFLGQTYKLAYIVGTISTRSGTMYRTIDGMSFIVDAVTLVPVTSTEQVVEKPSMGSVGASGPEPEGWPANYHFTISPFIDVMHVYAGGGVINGQDTTASYTAPVLGSYSGNNFYMAIGLGQTYKLAYIVGTVSTRSGTMYRTIDGMSFIVDAVTLVPV